MPDNRQTVQYRVVLHRVGKPTGLFDSPGFSILIRAKDAEDAVRQTEHLAVAHNRKFQVVDVYPAGRDIGAARSTDQPAGWTDGRRSK